MNKILIFSLFFMNASIFLQASEEKSSLNTLALKEKITYQQLPQKIRKNIAAYAGLNEPIDINGSCQTKLHFAIYHDRFEKVQFLTILGVDLNIISPDIKETTLILAMPCLPETQEDNKIAQYLIRHGVNINTVDEKQKTPVHHAINSEAIYILKLLIRAKAHLNISDQSNYTPLDQAHISAMSYTEKPCDRKKYYEMAKILSKYGGISSIPLEIMPSDEIMQQQYENAEIQRDRFIKSLPLPWK